MVIYTDQLAYWKQRLEGANMVLELPTDRPRSSVQTFANARYSFVLSQELTVALEALSQQEGVTLFMILLAAFQTLLHRYTGQDDLLIGTPIAGRPQAELSDLIGNLANVLVLRGDLSGNPSFRELLRRVCKVTLEAYTHQNVSFAKLVETLQPEQDLRRSPLVQVMFVFEPAPLEALELEGLNLPPQKVEGGMTKCDLTLTMEDTEQGLRGWVEYKADLFDRETITRLVGHWQTLMAGIVADPEQPLSELPLLTEAERQLLLVEWNNTASDYPRDQCVHQLFEAQVERTPDAVAVVNDDAHLTYRQLNQRANQLAHYLQKIGVGPEILVGICVERSLEMIIGLLGILKAGGAYVPLDPSYPSERLAFMLADAQVKVLLTQERLIARVPKQEREIVFLDTKWDVISLESKENPISSVTAKNAAYIIYTSGSTGVPKGVVIQHLSLVNYTQAASAAYALKPSDRVLQFAALSFDASAEEIYPTLTKGAALVLRTNSILDSVALFLQKCRDWALTVVSLPTAYWHELTRKIAADTITLPPSLRLVIIGGERALPELKASWQMHVSQDVQLMNTYGPTEATIVATMHRLSRASEADATLREVPIGRPIANVQVYVLDRHLKPVPIGVPGELYIGGAGLARGYLSRPELTAEKFIPHPISSESGARLYKTGDLVRYLPGGEIEFLGRIDHQVKIRGFRIELGEIEAVLGEHSSVEKSVVIADEDVTGDKRLVAYVVPQEGQTLMSSELRRFAQERLPGYMVPSAFVLLEALPLTPSGKVDRRALPAPDLISPELQESFVAPMLPVHQQLIQIWEELLNVQPIGIRDSFFDLGGHSLLAVRLIDRIEQTWGKKISAATLLAGPTIEQLGNVLLQPEGTDAVLVESQVRDAKRSTPVHRQLTSRVKGVWSNLTRRH